MSAPGPTTPALTPKSSTLDFRHDTNNKAIPHLPITPQSLPRSSHSSSPGSIHRSPHQNTVFPPSPTRPSPRRRSSTTLRRHSSISNNNNISPSKVIYGDRFIPNRSGINLQAAYSLVNDSSSQSSPTKPTPSTNLINHKKCKFFFLS